MDVLKCEAFLAAVDHGSILAASAKLNYTSSGINRMITALEDELNVTLLIRSRTGVTLTEIGSRLLPSIKQFVECSAYIHEICKEEQNYVHDSITIGAYHGIAEHRLPIILNKFKMRYPGVRVNVLEGPYSMLVPMLKEHDLDCCLLCGSKDPDIVFEPLYREPIFVMQSANEPVTFQQSFPIKELGNHPFICFGSTPIELEGILKQNHINLDIRFTTRSIHTLYKMVESGLGISASGETDIKKYNGNVIVLPLDIPAFIDIGLVLPKDRIRPIVRRFADLIIATMRTDDVS